MRILISFLEKRRANSLVKASPIFLSLLKNQQVQPKLPKYSHAATLAGPALPLSLMSISVMRQIDPLMQLQLEGGCAFEHRFVSAAVPVSTLR